MAGTAVTIDDKPRFRMNRNGLIIGIVVVIALIVSGVVYMNQVRTQQQRRNVIRKTAIDTIADSVELYNVRSGGYPSLNNLNDNKWLVANMPDLKPDTLKDPSSKGGVVADPAPKIYAYAAKSSDGKGSCNNASSSCMSYVLTATLEGGGKYSKSGSN